MSYKSRDIRYRVRYIHYSIMVMFYRVLHVYYKVTDVCYSSMHQSYRATDEFYRARNVFSAPFEGDHTYPTHSQKRRISNGIQETFLHRHRERPNPAGLAEFHQPGPRPGQWPDGGGLLPRPSAALKWEYTTLTVSPLDKGVAWCMIQVEIAGTLRRSGL